VFRSRLELAKENIGVAIFFGKMRMFGWLRNIARILWYVLGGKTIAKDLLRKSMARGLCCYVASQGFQVNETLTKRGASWLSNLWR
jgi:hypothetical protein